MKKSVKTAAAVAAAGVAASLGTAEIMYECILNVKLANKMKTKFHIENKNMMDVYLNHPLFLESYDWFNAQERREAVIYDREGYETHSYIIENPNHTDKWAVCVHGYGGDALAQAPFAKHFYEMGFSVLFPHMRGHEHDTNKYSSMGYHERYAVASWTDYLAELYPECRIVIHGVSMGAATTMLTTGENLPENVKCAVSDCGYSSCLDEFVYEFKQTGNVPTFPLLNMINAVSRLRGNFDIRKCSPEEAVKKSKTPTLFIHGINDDMVPYSMLDKVYNACAAEKERLDVPDAYHATSVAVDTESYFAKVDSFVNKYFG